MPVPRVPRGSCIDVAARFLAAQNRAAERALATHHAGTDPCGGSDGDLRHVGVLQGGRG